MTRNPVTPGSLASSTTPSSRRSRLSARFSGSKSAAQSSHSQQGDPFDEEHVNPLESTARWRLTANAMALRSGASFAFAIGNRSSPAPPAPSQTLLLDSTLSPEWKDKEVIQVDVWEPQTTRATAPATPMTESEEVEFKGETTEDDDDAFSQPVSQIPSRQTSRQPSRQSSRQLLRQLSRQPSRETSKQLFRQLSRTTSSKQYSDAERDAFSQTLEDAENAGPPPKRLALINFHGGGFVLGNGTDDARWAATVMESFNNAVIFSVNYRLAPGYPYPTPVEDCVDAILQIASRADEFHIDPSQIFLSGFSAGGTLALASWVVLQDPARWGYTLNLPVPDIAGFPLFYPLLDWTIPRAIKRRLCTHPDDTLSPGMTNLFDASYLYPPIPRDERDDPRLSPGLMPDEMLQRLPPVHLCLCERDMLLNEGLKFAERIRENKGMVTTRVVLGEKHAWDKPPPFAPPVSVSVEYEAAVVAMRHWLGDESEVLTRKDVGGVSDRTEIVPGITVAEWVEGEEDGDLSTDGKGKMRPASDEVHDGRKTEKARGDQDETKTGGDDETPTDGRDGSEGHKKLDDEDEDDEETPTYRKKLSNEAEKRASAWHEAY